MAAQVSILIGKKTQRMAQENCVLFKDLQLI